MHTAHTHTAHSTHLQTEGFAHPGRTVSLFSIESGMTVADFGAGSGAYIFAIAEALQGSGTVYAIDVQRDLLKRIHSEATRRHLSNVEILWGDLEKAEGSKLPSRSCDFVLISNILFQVEHRKVLLHEAKRILRDSGRLAIIDWTDSFNNMGPPREHVITEAMGCALVEENGFIVSDRFVPGAHHWGLICTPTDKKKLSVLSL